MARNLDLALRIRADLGNAKQVLDRLERELRQTGGAAQRAGRETGAVATGLARTERASRGLDRATRRMQRFEGAGRRAARSLNGLYLALGGIGAVAAVRSLVDAGLEIERLEQRFTFAAGGFAAGAQELAFVRAEAERLGISFGAAASGYSSLLAASRGTNVTVDQTREIFLGVAEASAVLRLSQDEVAGALRAVQQIMSKGTLQAEEIRGQLGERLPGAFQIAARAMGVTTAELNKMLELGQVASDEFLPRFGAQLRKEFAEGVPDAADSAAASFARLGNAIERLQQSVAKSGLLDWLARVTDGLTDAVDKAERLGPAIDAILLGGERDTSGPSDIVAEIEALAQSDPKAAQARLAELEDTAQAASRRVTELTSELGALGEPGLIDIEFFDRRKLQTQLGLARSVFQAVIRQLSDAQAAVDAAQLERLGEALRNLPASSPSAAEADDSGREKAEERANAAIERLRTQHEDRIARIGRDRAELIERSRIEAIRRVDALEAAGGSAEKAVDARLAIERRYARELSQLRGEELRKALENEDRLAERRARAREDALRDLEAIGRGLLGPYDRAVAEVEAWRAATVAAFEEAGLSAAEYGETVRTEVSERLAEAAEEETNRRLRESRRWQDGAARAFRSYAESATDAGTAAEQAVTNGLRGMEDAVARFVTTGKLSFSDLANSILADFARLQTNRLLGSLLGGLNLFGGGGGFAAGTVPGGTLFFHGGGTVGSGAQHRRYGIPPAVFARAPRYHEGGIAGLRPNEVPTILERGETVRTADQERRLGAGTPVLLRAEVINESGERLEAREAQATFDPETWAIRVVVDNIAQGGTIGRQIEGIVRQGGL